MNVLAVGAHPDDIEILAGGTLAKYAKRGDHVFMMVATNGNVGSSKLSKEEIAAVMMRNSLPKFTAIGLGWPLEGRSACHI